MALLWSPVFALERQNTCAVYSTATTCSGVGYTRDRFLSILAASSEHEGDYFSAHHLSCHRNSAPCARNATAQGRLRIARPPKAPASRIQVQVDVGSPVELSIQKVTGSPSPKVTRRPLPFFSMLETCMSFLRGSLACRARMISWAWRALHAHAHAAQCSSGCRTGPVGGPGLHSMTRCRVAVLH